MTPILRRLLTAMLGSAVAASALSAALVPTAAAAPGPGWPPPGGIVVKMRSGADPGALTQFGVGLSGIALAPQGIYLMRPTNPAAAADPAQTAALARQISATDGVQYAEPNMVGGLLAASGFHAWPDGPPAAVGVNPALWSNQRAAITLRLNVAHLISHGVGMKVAVIDTGVDATHPALRGSVVAGWNFVDGNGDTADVRSGVDSNRNGVKDEAAGHGTFVAGIVHLVAPGARIVAYRVLDSDGQGTTYAAAEAITAAARAGAKVINLSFGTPDGTTSRLLADAVAFANARGAVVVAAAGNTGGSAQTFPAALPSVLSVSALATGADQLASFSTRGTWVKVAAPGEGIVGPMPGGGFVRWSGTSMAAPFVSGQAALVWSRNPARPSASVTGAITRTSDRLARGQTAYGAIDVLGSLRLPCLLPTPVC